MNYLEVAKECPKCHEMKLFFCCMKGKLGVKCRSCGYNEELKEVKK